MKPEKWYQRRLAKYFTEQYEDVTEFWNDPAPNQWLFDIPELNVKIELLNEGRIEELKKQLEDEIYQQSLNKTPRRKTTIRCHETIF